MSTPRKTYEVLRDPTTTATKWMFKIKQNGRPICAQGGFDTAKDAAVEAKKLV
jgi:hypothetical protein